MDNKKIIQQLRDRGYTFQQIGILLGISRQRCHQIYKWHKGVLTSKEIPRERVRKRDNYTCQKCGKVWETGQRRFDIHHIDCDNKKTRQYDKVNEMSNMITLCHKCHLNLPEHRESMKSKSGDN